MGLSPICEGAATRDSAAGPVLAWAVTTAQFGQTTAQCPSAAALRILSIWAICNCEQVFIWKDLSGTFHHAAAPGIFHRRKLNPRINLRQGNIHLHAPQPHACVKP